MPKVFASWFWLFVCLPIVVHLLFLVSSWISSYRCIFSYLPMAFHLFFVVSNSHSGCITSIAVGFPSISKELGRGTTLRHSSRLPFLHLCPPLIPVRKYEWNVPPHIPNNIVQNEVHPYLLQLGWSQSASFGLHDVRVPYSTRFPLPLKLCFHLKTPFLWRQTLRSSPPSFSQIVCHYLE